MYAQQGSEQNIKEQIFLEQKNYPSEAHWGPSIPAHPENLAGKHALSGVALLSCKDQEYSQRSWESDQSRILLLRGRKNHKLTEFLLKNKSLESSEIWKCSPSEVAYLSFWSRLFGNLSMVSHFTRWMVPPTFRITVPPARFRSFAATFLNRNYAISDQIMIKSQLNYVQLVSLFLFLLCFVSFIGCLFEAPIGYHLWVCMNAKSFSYKSNWYTTVLRLVGKK